MEEKSPNTDKLGTAGWPTPSLQQQHQPPCPKRTRFSSLASRATIVLALALISYTYFGYLPRNGPSSRPLQDDDLSTFDWSSTPTLPDLEYQRCYEIWGDFQCARLELPMDYWNGTTNETISLAVIKKPAAVPVTDKRYGGPILFNPGGPGGSGIGLIVQGRGLDKILDANSTDGKFFDLMSFDPRGVGETEPLAICSEDPVLAQSFALRVLEEGILGSSDASLGRLWSMSQARSKSCSLPPKDGAVDIKRYMSTAYVGRDMLEIVEAHGRWREREAKKLTTSSGLPAELEALKYKKGEEKIQYWGFSYGTYLGLTFAAMFPDRVQRLVVDGVVDAYDYKKTLWYDNLVDTEKDLDLLYYHCARVGYPRCPLANETGETTTEGVKQRVLNITQSLYHNPLPVIGASPDVVQYSDVKTLIFIVLYSPIATFPAMAQLLADLERGNGTIWAQVLKPQHGVWCFADTKLVAARSGDAQMAIACTDGDDQSFLDKAHFQEHWKKLEKLSSAGGAIWSTIRMHCVHFRVRAQHRFEGPWVGNTSHPILLMGNTADPVTPLGNAVKMAKGFEGAVTLTQDSGGHCTLNAPSKCTRDYVRRYFQTGELPAENVTCPADDVPFGKGDEESGYDTEDAEFRGDMERLQAALRSAWGVPLPDLSGPVL